MQTLYPQIKPYARHDLAVEAPHVLYVDESGSPEGLPSTIFWVEVTTSVPSSPCLTTTCSPALRVSSKMIVVSNGTGFSVLVTTEDS